MKDEIIEKYKEVYTDSFTEEEYLKLSNITLELEKILNYYPVNEILDCMRGVR